MPKTVSEFRREIESIDAKIVDLLAERMALAIQIGYAKRRKKMPILDPAREEAVYQHILKLQYAPMEPKDLKKIYERIMEISRTIQNRIPFD